MSDQITDPGRLGEEPGSMRIDVAGNLAPIVEDVNRLSLQAIASSVLTGEEVCMSARGEECLVVDPLIVLTDGFPSTVIAVCPLRADHCSGVLAVIEQEIRANLGVIKVTSGFPDIDVTTPNLGTQPPGL